MKYELEPDNRNCPDEELLADLCTVAQDLGKSSVTKEEYDVHGRFCAATMQNRFGSWNKALARSGLAIDKRIDIPVDELVGDLKRVASELGTRTVTREQYRAHGTFADITVSRHFGSWAAALIAANLQPTSWKPQATEDDLFDNMASVWEHVGRQPKQKDFRPPVSRYSHAAYVRQYGSWRAALEAFVAAADSETEENAVAATPAPTTTDPTAPSTPIHRTNRNPSWRLRFLVMRRDNFACRLCGASPAKNPSVSLQIDHVHPWSAGGETVTSNLQTCCEVCNIGKSDLPIVSETGE